jgi:beta-lactamase regulating signal transducer with metallopeptidase domain
VDTFQTIEALTILLFDVAAKGTVLLVLATVASVLLRRKSAAMRHSLWTLTMLSLILLPVASWLLPKWNIPILPAVEPLAVATIADSALESTPVESLPRDASTDSSEADITSPSAESKSLQVSGEAPTTTAISTNNSPDLAAQPSAAFSMFAGWTQFGFISFCTLLVCFVGAVFFGFAMMCGVWRTINFHRRSQPITEGVWRRLIRELSGRLQLQQRVELRELAEPIVPLTSGVFRPIVLLPKLARDWDESMQRTVLLHELAHVKRGDVLCQLIGRVACTLYWFHPLAWYGLRQLRLEGEQACDDAVVETGEKASDYAEQLLQVARLCCAPHGLTFGVAMAEGNSLERRVTSLFD